MKKVLVFIFVLASLSAFAKKVKFRVNMQLQLVDTGGVHITGDFQDEAGFPADWDPGTTSMMQDVADTNIYWAIVDIPAFRVYEFKFVNGIHGYQQEFVPLESRVNYNFIDSRWIYVDSLANDTMELAAIRYGGNAPAGKSLLRFYVDMQNETVNTNGVHVATGMNAWSTTDARMYSFDGDVYEYISYVDSNQSVAREYKFLNGNTAGTYEVLAGWCDNANQNREVVAPRDTMLPVVCFSFCAACSTVGITEVGTGNFTMTPNPVTDQVQLTFADNQQRVISTVDQLGREVDHQSSNGTTSVIVPVSELAPGVYFVRVMESNGRVNIQKLVVE